MLTDTFGLSHLWAQSDLLIKLVAFTLVVMSVASWYLIVVRATRQLRPPAGSHGDVARGGRPPASTAAIFSFSSPWTC